jgi:hypothetical protein
MFCAENSVRGLVSLIGRHSPVSQSLSLLSAIESLKDAAEMLTTANQMERESADSYNRPARKRGAGTS